MAVTLVGGVGTGSTRFETNVDVELTMPSGIQAGDLLFAVTCQQNGSGNGTLTDDATGGNSWTHVDAIDTNGSNIDNQSLWVKEAVANDASATLSYSPPSGGAGAMCMVAFRGADTTTKYENLAERACTNSGSDNYISGFTPGSADGFVCFAAAVGNNWDIVNVAATDPGTFNDVDLISSNPGGSDQCIALFAEAKPNTNATGQIDYDVWSEDHDEVSNDTYNVSVWRWYVPEGSTADTLTASELSLTAPSIDSSTIGQEHDLTSTETTSGAPVLDSSTIGQTHALTGTELQAANPSLESPVITEQNELTATELQAASPVLDNSTIGQTHALTGSELQAPNPSPEASTLGQTHEITASELQAPNPSLETPGVGQEHDLTATEISSGAPTSDQPAIAEENNLTASELIAGAPTFDLTTIGQTHAITAGEVSYPASVHETSTMGQTHVISSSELQAASPTLEQPDLVQGEYLEADELTMPSATHDTPGINQTHVLSEVDNFQSAPVFDAPDLGQEHDLPAPVELQGASPTFGHPTPGQVHVLTVNDLDYPSATFDAPILSEPTGDAHSLVADELLMPAIILGTVGMGRGETFGYEEDMGHRYPSNMVNRGVPTEQWPNLDTGELATPGMIPSATDTLTLTANTLYIFPFFLPVPVALVSANIMLTGGVAASTGKIALYEWDHVNRTCLDVVDESSAAFNTTSSEQGLITDTSLAQDLHHGWYAWAIVDGGAVTVRTLSGHDAYVGGLIDDSTTTLRGITHYTASGTGVIAGSFSDDPTVTAVKSASQFLPNQAVLMDFELHPAIS